MKTLITLLAILFTVNVATAQIDVVPTDVAFRWQSYDPTGTIGTDFVDSARASFGDGIVDTSLWVRVDSVGELGTWLNVYSEEDTCATLPSVQWSNIDVATGRRIIGKTTALDSLVNGVHTGATTRFYGTQLYHYALQNGATYFRLIVPDPTTIGMFGTATSDAAGSKRIPHLQGRARYPRY